MRVRVLARVRAVFSLVEQAARPRLVRDLVVAEVEREIADVAVVVGHPDALQIDPATRQSRRRRLEIDLTTRGARRVLSGT